LASHETSFERKIHLFINEQLEARVTYWLHLSHQYYLHKSISVSPNLNCTVLCIMSVIDRLHLIQLCLWCTEWLSGRPKRSSLSSLVNAFDRESFRHQLQDKLTLQVIHMSQILYIVVAHLCTIKCYLSRKARNLNKNTSSRFFETTWWIFWIRLSKVQLCSINILL